MSLRRTVWGSQPSPAARGPAQRGRRRAPHPDRRPRLLHGPGGDAEIARRPARARQRRELLGQRRGQGVHGLVELRPALVERRPEEVELLVDVTRAHADDHPASRQHVERGELLGGPQRVPLGGDVDVGDEPHPGGDPGQPPQGGDGVVPGRAHGPGQPARDGGVIAHRHVEEAALLGLARHPGELGGTRRASPSPPRRSSTGTGSAAGCRRRPLPRG